MQYGLPRAVPMGIIGFLLGAAFVIGLRGLQSMEAVWDPQIGIIFAALNSTIFFVWGMGGFDRKMAEHHVEAHYDDEKGVIVVEGLHDDHDDEHAAEPRRVLTGEVWRIAFWITVLVVVLLGFASLAFSPSLQVSGDPLANTNQIGFYTMNLFGNEVVVSELVAFIVFIAIMLLSLAVIASLIGSVFYRMSVGITEVKAAGNVPLNALPSPAVAGALGSGIAGTAVTTTPVRERTVGEKARAVTVPLMIAFALLYPNVHLGLALFGIGVEPGRLAFSLLITLVLTLFILNLMPANPMRHIEPLRVLLVSVAAFISSTIIFTVIVNFVASAADWLYVPDEPVRAVLPMLSAAFLTPFIVDAVFNREGRSLPDAVRTLFVPALVFNILYIVFYGPAIGLIFAGEPLRTLVSAINTVVITLLILRPAEVLWTIGRFARWVSGLLRRLPQGLGQR